MEMVTRGPVSAASVLWQRGPGWVLTLVCKATFDIVPGEAKLRMDPSPPAERDVSWDAPHGRSLRVAMDLVPMKANVDVVLTGHAYAPFGRPVKSLTARLVVGSLDKSIEVWADRYLDPTGALQVGHPFARMPLVYERAAGGTGTWNIAGMVVGPRDPNGNVLLPNLQPLGIQTVGPDKLFIAPVGFGPIPADWPSRLEKLGRRSPRDIPPQWNGQSVPDDIPREYFNSAPPDQQISTLREDETITLEKLHSSHPSLKCKLPGLRPTASYEVAGATAPISLRADTLHIDTDRGICTVVWRGHLTLRDPREASRVIVVLDAPQPSKRQPTFTGAEPAPLAPVAAPRPGIGVHMPPVDPALEGTMNLGPVPVAAAPAKPLPFAGAGPSAPGAPHPLSQSSSSWDAVRAASPVVPASPSWNAEATLPPVPPQPPRAAEQSSPSWQALKPQPAPSALSQSGSWGRSDPVPDPSVGLGRPREISSPQDTSSARVASLTDPIPPPVAFAPLPPPVAPPVHLAVAPPAPVQAPPVDSRWATGESKKRETIGMQAVSGALALSDPKFEPLPSIATGAVASSTSLQLIWFDPESVARIRRVPRWKKHLDEFHREPLDRDLDDSGAREPWEIEDRREVFEVLAHGALSDARGVEEALAEGRRADGKLVPPLVLVEGELEIQFDELEGLKAAASTAAPLVTSADEGLRAAVEAADAFFNRPGLLATPTVCDGLRTRIREAFVREKKSLQADYLDKQVEQALLMGRCYQKRRLFGGVLLRAHLWVAGEKDAMLAYVPEDLAGNLPMFRRFQVRVVADVHPQVDQYEMRPLALRVLIAGRVT